MNLCGLFAFRIEFIKETGMFVNDNLPVGVREFNIVIGINSSLKNSHA